ncbi:lytic polysaccharide monooxygenase auxiliary activity family 9 protein [Glycomyces tenuis]|uniref:lytic polysaccharide monooxygenase auxiliary activity family 9 protein n=1 Tax=Glycomyces tenuis TaxID=58116 RepID=UPI0003FB8CD2|nr:lytic polysaccharide monooxygenase auxiliary activity family 9 protein [Glycomyces tenuis]
MNATAATGMRRRTAVILAAVIAAAAAAASALFFAPSSDAHGTAIGPPSRNYSCWERWGHDFQNPDMATEDPMCWQAWQADPNAMWNWNGNYLEQVGGDHEGAIPDGQLCSSGQDRYAALDAPGRWQTTPVDQDFTFTNHDQADHGADYYRIYVTEQGFDPTTQALGWDDLELVAETGVIAPGEGEPSDTVGTLVNIDVSAPGRTGHHIVYMIWQASHFDQSFYSCSDVYFQ